MWEKYNSLPIDKINVKLFVMSLLNMRAYKLHMLSIIEREMMQDVNNMGHVS